jgi:hypothetical protein
MAYNAALIATQRARKDTAARAAFRNKYQNLPFVEPSDFQDGDYQIRLWPEHPQKIPTGFLRYRSHTLEMRSENDKKNIQCPRSTNWDPMPLYWEDEDGSEVTPEKVDPQEHWPVYKERCYCCELTDLLAREGRTQDFSESVSKRVLPGLYGDDSYFFPATIKAEVAIRSKRVGNNGKEYEDVEYRPSATNLLKCILKLRPGTFLDFLWTVMEQVSDLNNLQTGRWIVLKKINGGRGVGGYQPMLAPFPSAAGFELTDGDYQNFWAWGTGGQKGPSKRMSYSEVEALCGNPQMGLPAIFWWAQELRDAGIPLTDAEASDAPF